MNLHVVLWLCLVSLALGTLSWVLFRLLRRPQPHRGHVQLVQLGTILLTSEAMILSDSHDVTHGVRVVGCASGKWTVYALVDQTDSAYVLGVLAQSEWDTGRIAIQRLKESVGIDHLVLVISDAARANVLTVHEEWQAFHTRIRHGLESRPVAQPFALTVSAPYLEPWAAITILTIGDGSYRVQIGKSEDGVTQVICGVPPAFLYFQRSRS